MPPNVKIVEVGPRDGLQNEKQLVPTATKIELIELLADTGLPAIEVTSFVSPKWVPQMADHAEVLAGIRRKCGVKYSVLVPNLQGFEAAVAVGVEEVAVLTAASETFSRKNINCSISKSLDRILPILEICRQQRIKVRGYVSCALGCPYEGDVSLPAVSDLASRLWQMGCDEISLGDTIGVGTPSKVQFMIEAVARQVPITNLAGHYHDTFGQALGNVQASLEMGLAVFDSSVAGLGGCPFAKKASGNIATEDVVYLMNSLGIETGVDMDKLIVASQFLCSTLERPVNSKAASAWIRSRSS